MKATVIGAVLMLLTVGACLGKEREFEKFVERHQHWIPDETKQRLFREKRAEGGKHWCCSEDTTHPVTVRRTKIVQTYREGYYLVKIGESKCGTFGWSKCTLYGTRTHQVSYTYVTQFDLDLDRTCKSHELTCCHGYILLNKDGGNNCFALADLDQEQRNLFARLKSFEGLLGRRK